MYCSVLTVLVYSVLYCIRMSAACSAQFPGIFEGLHDELYDAVPDAITSIYYKCVSRGPTVTCCAVLRLQQLTHSNSSCSSVVSSPLI